MSINSAYSKFRIKYSQDTMRVPPSPEVKERPIQIEETVLPPPPKVPSFDNVLPARNDKPRNINPDLSADRAFFMVYSRCKHLGIFSDSEMDYFDELQYSDPIKAFDEITSILEKKLYNIQTNLNLAKQLSERIFK